MATKTEPRVLSGRYRIDRLIGRGGMAEVYAGVDVTLDRPVAVKILRSELAADPEFARRLDREAKLAAGLVHPDIVAVYDTGTDRGMHYIVMETVGGRTLSEVLAEGALLPERAAEIAESVAGALSFAHHSGVVHCDVKPANIMITRGGAVKVMDFGIASAASAGAGRQRMIMATANYLSPERARGEPGDARSDVYSLGVVLYEMLTGRPPFDGDAVSVARQHVRDAPPRPSRVNREVPHDLEAITLRAMAKDPERRYASAELLRMELEAARLARLDESPAPSGPPARTEPRRVRATRPRRGWVMAGAEGLAVASVIGLVFWAGALRSGHPTKVNDQSVPHGGPRPVVVASPSAPTQVSPSPSGTGTPTGSPSPTFSPSPSPSPTGILDILPSIPPFP